ncbi:MAG TPA: hypothetical protein PKA00_15540 [Saprospiraceae bacterium]|nr:hypothetical protein [Saprospiraceae bacterium]HMQ84326.1 hypothetical protein [Saprospiraceae bacterium]
MKKGILFLVAFLILGAVAQMFLAWWSLVVVAAGLAYFFQLPPLRAWGWGWLGAALLWGGLAWWLSQKNDHLLAQRIGMMFGGLPPIGLILITALFGSIFGGLGAVCGSLARRMY